MTNAATRPMKVPSRPPVGPVAETCVTTMAPMTPEAFAKQLKSQGYRFVGPTSVYAFMQNVGVVNDHIHRNFERPTAARHGKTACR